MRTANYILNQDKQVKGIYADAKIPDYDVNVNCNDENCCIKCSTGFYKVVVKPFFSSLAQHSVLSCMDIALTVSEMKITNDKNNIEALRFFRFQLMNHQENIGVVTIHLHHSNRNVQIQGGSTMPDSSKAAVWFAKNFLIPRFHDQANLKKFLIKRTNEAFLQNAPLPPQAK